MLWKRQLCQIHVYKKMESFWCRGEAPRFRLKVFDKPRTGSASRSVVEPSMHTLFLAVMNLVGEMRVGKAHTHSWVLPNDYCVSLRVCVLSLMPYLCEKAVGTTWLETKGMNSRENRPFDVAFVVAVALLLLCLLSSDGTVDGRVAVNKVKPVH